MGLYKFIGHTALAILLGMSFANAQNRRVVIHGRITDKNHKGIGYAAIQNSNTGEGINSDLHGRYILKTTLPASLSAFSLGYTIQQKQVYAATTDSVEVNFELEENAAELQAVTITASHPPLLISESPNLMDFDMKDNQLWLVYSVKGGDKIEVVDTGGRHVTQAIYKYYFRKDSIGQTLYGPLYSIHKDSLLLFGLDNNNAITIKAMSLRDYKLYTSALVGFKYPLYYYKTFDSLESRINYFCFDKSTNTKNIFYRYMDTKLYEANKDIEDRMLALQFMLLLKDSLNYPDIQVLRDETQNFKADENNNQTYAGIQQDIITKSLSGGASLGEVENALSEAQSRINLNYGYEAENEHELQAFYTMKSKVFSWLRIINDSIYIFNFNSSMMSVYSPSNIYVRQVQFDFYIHYGFSWRPLDRRKIDILVDEEKQECYYYHKSLGYTYLGKINLATGKISYTIKLKYPFVSKVRISGGYAYFSYFNTQDRDNIYNGKTCICKQKLD